MENWFREELNYHSQVLEALLETTHDEDEARAIRKMLIEIARYLNGEE